MNNVSHNTNNVSFNGNNERIRGICSFAHDLMRIIGGRVSMFSYLPNNLVAFFVVAAMNIDIFKQFKKHSKMYQIASFFYFKNNKNILGVSIRKRR